MQIGQELKGNEGTYILKSQMSEEDTYKQYIIESPLKKQFFLREYDCLPCQDVLDNLHNCSRNKIEFPNVCAIHDYFELYGKFYIVQDYYVGLQRVYAQQKQKFITDLLNAITQLHENDIIHREIKPCKIAFSDKQVKLINFGKYHEIVDPRKANKICQQNFDAPETLKIEKYQKASDIWSLANVIYWVYSDGQMLFQGNTDLDIQKSRLEFCKDQSSVFKKIDQLPINTGVQEMLKAMLHPDPAKRPEIQIVCRISQQQPHQSLFNNPQKSVQPPVRTIVTEWPSFGFTTKNQADPPQQLFQTAHFHKKHKLDESFIVQQQLK